MSEKSDFFRRQADAEERKERRLKEKGGRGRRLKGGRPKIKVGR